MAKKDRFVAESYGRFPPDEVLNFYVEEKPAPYEIITRVRGLNQWYNHFVRGKSIGEVKVSKFNQGYNHFISKFNQIYDLFVRGGNIDKIIASKLNQVYGLFVKRKYAEESNAPKFNQGYNHFISKFNKVCNLFIKNRDTGKVENPEGVNNWLINYLKELEFIYSNHYLDQTSAEISLNDFKSNTFRFHESLLAIQYDVIPVEKFLKLKHLGKNDLELIVFALDDRIKSLKSVENKKNLLFKRNSIQRYLQTN